MPAWRCWFSKASSAIPRRDLFVFGRRTGSLLKIIWYDGIGMSLYTKRVGEGRFVWPSVRDGILS